MIKSLRRLAFVVGIVSAISSSQMLGSIAHAQSPSSPVQPDAADRHQVFLSGYGELTVYGAASNASIKDTDAHIYLYLPPLRLKTTDDGRPDTERVDSDQTVTVTFSLEGSSSDLAKRIHAALENMGVSVLSSKNVRPLQYSFIALDDDSGTWRAHFPPNRSSGVLPLPQPWIPFTVEFETDENQADPAGDFLDRLNGDDFNIRVVLGYGGRELVRNMVELTTQ